MKPPQEVPEEIKDLLIPLSDVYTPRDTEQNHLVHIAFLRGLRGQRAPRSRKTLIPEFSIRWIIREADAAVIEGKAVDTESYLIEQLSISRQRIAELTVPSQDSGRTSRPETSCKP